MESAMRSTLVETSKHKLLEEVLSLPSDVPLDLVDKLLQSLNLPVDEEIDRLWKEEAVRRVEEIEQGKATRIPEKTVFAEIRAKYGE